MSTAPCEMPLGSVHRGLARIDFVLVGLWKSVWAKPLIVTLFDGVEGGILSALIERTPHLVHRAC